MNLSTHVFIAASLDGYIARLNGDLDWLDAANEEGEDYGYQAFIQGMDVLVMGRHTFEKVLSFGDWPYDDIAVIVLSSTLEQNEIPEQLQDKLSVYNYSPRALCLLLDDIGMKNIYIDGGKTIQSFLRAGLVDEITLSHIPILLGEGIPLFSSLKQDIALQHINTTTFNNGLVQSHYRLTAPTG
jgi:dihydrofolate reductase